MNTASFTRCAVALLAAAVLPAAVVGLLGRSWVPFALVAAVASAHAVLLGLPLYLLLRWKRRASLLSAVLGGTLVAVLPVSALLLPSATSLWVASSAVVGGTSPNVGRLAARASLANHADTVGVFALFGAASGLCFALCLGGVARTARRPVREGDPGPSRRP